MIGRRSTHEPLVASADVGGTFTDILVLRGRKLVAATKVPTDPAHPDQAVFGGLRKISRTGYRELVHATTLATNALLSRSTVNSNDTALLTTEGFRDVIEIGRQNRSELYNLRFSRPTPLVRRSLRFEVETRRMRSGFPRSYLQMSAVRQAVKTIKRRGGRSIAISLLHAYAEAGNEQHLARIAREEFDFVSVSSEIAPEPREYERTSTTVLNAVLMPIVSEYVRRLGESHRGLRIPEVSVMSSSGGLVSAQEIHRRPVQLIESGPAAGVIAAASLARAAGIENVISFDMGGTTAKAGTIRKGRIETTSDYEVGGLSHHGRLTKGSGYPIRFPFIDLVEVSAGGGTIIGRDAAGGLIIGPGSAGSVPGPACYGRGGTAPTLTDATLVQGILGPSILGGEMPLDMKAAKASLSRLGAPNKVAESALRLVDLEMARAIRLVTVERGLDPAGFSLVAFGGAGPQYAARVAAELGIRRVVVPPRPGLYSALGLLHSDWKYEVRRSFPQDLKQGFREMEQELGRRHPGARFERFAECRYSGQGSELTVSVGRPARARVLRDFERQHEATFGFHLDRPIEIVVIRAFAVVRRAKPTFRRPPLSPLNVGERRVRVAGRPVAATTFNRAGLKPGLNVAGPSCVDDYDSTIFIPPGWKGEAGRFGEFTLRQEDR